MEQTQPKDIPQSSNMSHPCSVYVRVCTHVEMHAYAGIDLTYLAFLVLLLQTNVETEDFFDKVVRVGTLVSSCKNGGELTETLNISVLSSGLSFSTYRKK